MTIRKIIAAVSILVFALAIAPKQLLHDAFANHRHFYANESNESTLSQSGFICNCENLVAESAFLHFPDPVTIGNRAEFSVFVPQHHNFYTPIPVESFRLRGPPSFL